MLCSKMIRKRYQRRESGIVMISMGLSQNSSTRTSSCLSEFHKLMGDIEILSGKLYKNKFEKIISLESTHQEGVRYTINTS
jgi:hypothetical protein